MLKTSSQSLKSSHVAEESREHSDLLNAQEKTSYQDNYKFSKLELSNQIACWDNVGINKQTLIKKKNTKELKSVIELENSIWIVEFYVIT